MKKADENRYPTSAQLFKFCKEALNIKHNFEVKVIDQHVGGILGFDPADCSHWKKGKKNIKSLRVVNTIAEHLEVDPRIVTDLISGRADLEESIQEYKGYGAFSLSQKYYDELKREYFRNPARFTIGGEARSFEQVTDLLRDSSLAVVDELLRKAEVASCPVLIPELAAALPGIEFRAEAELPEAVAKATQEGARFVIRYRDGEMKPHIRFLLAREIGRALLSNQLTDTEDELVSARINHFALLLLMPTSLLQPLMRQLDPTQDLVGQLAEFFWVSRSIVNLRLRDFFAFGN